MSDASATDGRRPLVVVGVTIVVLLVLAALWFLVVSPLLAGDAEDDADFDPRAGQPDVTATEPTADPTETTDEDVLAALPIETYEIFLSRDPFEPVIPAADAGGGGTDADGDGVPDGGTDTDGDGVPDDGTDGDGDGTDGDGDGAVEHNAVLIDVFVDDSGQARALVRVDDRIYTVGEGDIFADGYAVVAIDGSCV
ncbi:MAG: hypothetical protein KY457_14315, partial [Actinobacteria bacterium]|nr:hypothetical protein [Actinomycetota bacterium]